MAIVEAARDGVRADVARFRVEHRQLRFLRRADAALGIEHDHARVRHAVEGVGDGAAGVTRGRREDGQRRAPVSSAAISRAIIAGADVLERQGRTVKQLERVTRRARPRRAGSESSAPRRRPLRRSSRRARRGYTAAARGMPISVSVRYGSRASSSAGHRLDRLRARTGRRPGPAPRRAPCRMTPPATRWWADPAPGWLHERSRTARRYEAHVEMTRAPREAIAET